MIYNKPRDYDVRILPKAITQKPGFGTKRKEKRQKANLLQIGAFFLMLYAGTVVAFILPLRPSYSASEKRNLKAFPSLTVEAIHSGTYFDDIGTWFSDTFPFRENLTKLNTSINKLAGFDSIVIHGDVESGDDIPDTPLDVDVSAVPSTTAPETTEAQTTSPETTLPQTTVPPTTAKKPSTTSSSKPNINVQTMGAILVAGDSAYEYFNFSSSLTSRFIGLVSNIKPVAGSVNVYTVIPPTSIDITLNDAVRADVSSSDQQKALDYINASLKNVTPVTGLYDIMREHRDEYIYFRTDHHWTALGAYYAYERFTQLKPIVSIALDSYETVTYDGFLGSFYASSGQNSALAKNPDSVIAYKPQNNVDFSFTQTDGQTIKWNVINDVTDYEENSKYLTFVGGDNPYAEINNKDIEKGQNCLVIKESFGNAFIPFLIPHYKNIYIIDPRYYNGTLSEFAASHEIYDVLFIANISTTRNEVYINALDKFVK